MTSSSEGTTAPNSSMDICGGYCGRRRIQFTRGRPYKKDDNAHIAQKNWTHVRKVLGYVRYDSEPALAAINAVYADLRLLQNLFLPTVQLVTKERVGARVRRHYDRPHTPLERVRQSTGAHRGRVAALVTLQQTIDPFVLAQRIDHALAAIYHLANHRRARARGRCPTCGRQERVHPVVGKPQSGFSTAPTRLFFFIRFGNRNCGATMRRSVTVTYGLTGIKPQNRAVGLSRHARCCRLPGVNSATIATLICALIRQGSRSPGFGCAISVTASSRSGT